MTKTRLEKIVYSFHHPRSLTTGRRARSRESLGDYIARFTREMEEGTRLNIHKLRYGPSTIMFPRNGGRSSIGWKQSIYYMIKVSLATACACMQRGG